MKIHFGIVADNNDPLKIGRCKIKIVGIYDSVKESELPWLQSMVPVNNETIFPPAIGSQVVCMELDEHNTFIILGIVPAIDNISELPENNNRSIVHYPYNRCLVTKSGHVFEIDDTPNGEEINIIHSSKNSYIKLKSNGEVEIGGACININGSSSINLNAPNISVDGAVNVVTGATGEFTDYYGKSINVVNGIVTEIN